MSYTPTTWQTGDVVSSEKLNKMEEGIANAHSEEYIVAETDEWLEENITQETGYVLDRSLQSANAAAPADIVGDIQEDLSDALNAISQNAENIKNIINLNRPDDVFTLGNFVGGTMYNGVLQPSNKKCITSTDSFDLMQSILLGAFISQANTDGTTWKIRFSFFDRNRTYISQVGYGDYNGEFTDVIPATAATFRVSLSLYEGSTNPDITPDDYTSARLVGLRFMYKQTYATEEEIGAIPQNLTQYDYYGDRIDIRPKKIAFKNYLTVSGISSVNGSAVYGDYLFTAKDKMDKIAITNMKTKTSVQVISMTAVNSYHCNNINFGNEKYDIDDPFPLLYVSMENASEHKAVVLRITESGGTYSATEVQTITYPDNATAGMYYQNCYVDAENSYLYISGASLNSFVKGNGNKLVFKKYNLPLLSAGNVQLTNADVLSSFEMEMITSPQGGFILGNKLIQSFGYGSGTDQTKHICMIDLNLGGLATDIRLDKYGITKEQESVFMWDGGLYMMDTSYKVTRVYV